MPTSDPLRAQQRFARAIAIAAGADVAAAAPRSWRHALERAAPDGVESLARACESAADAAARHVSWRTEPLSARVPVAYLAEVDAEARRLRAAATARDRVAT
ncbi:hypothetical protein [Pseudonocardia broussonetiae]|uniref:Uncharacterized protein n=1 Tax=Pseudonocardia broussonetiae TaxID=2736640 RepID=A0A6M6JTG0_9PSEU|nr:hypothetical protein [Pseudonocardia broussonetiae]QJY51148.1 hypothetical protein HOP40_34775 [Pseudonocardia broussonetiae]